MFPSQSVQVTPLGNTEARGVARWPGWSPFIEHLLCMPAPHGYLGMAIQVHVLLLIYRRGCRGSPHAALVAESA